MRFALLFILTLVGCTTPQMVKTAATTSQAYVLIQELDDVTYKLNALALDNSERVLVNQGLEDIHNLLDRYDNDPAQLLIDIPIARLRIDEGSGAFLTTQAGYQAYLARTGQPVDLQLKMFEDLSISFKGNLIDTLDELEAQGVRQVDSGLGMENLSLALKALILVL